MKRRRLIALVAAVGLLAVGLLLTVAVVVVTRTNMGQRWVARTAEQYLLARCRCTWNIGKVSGGLLSGVSIDGVSVYDEHHELFFFARRVTAEYSFRDLIEPRIYLRHVTLDQPYVHIRQYVRNRADTTWNYKRIFKLGENKATAIQKRLTPDLFLVLDSVRINDGAVEFSQLWSPDDSLRGTARDSSIRVHLARTEQRFERFPDYRGMTHRYQWRNLYAMLPHVRLSHPDSNKFGKEFVVDNMRVDERDPPFKFSNLRGTIRTVGDSLWLDLPHFDLPGSTGDGHGKVTWGSDLPVRYNLSIKGDSVLMNDIAWIYPTLPRAGGGSMLLSIRNDPKNLRVINYGLTKLDVRSTKSHLTGAMTFSVGGPVLAIKDLDLVLNPVDFDLIDTLSGGPLSVDWRGQLVGTLKGKGGPLNDFSVDAMRLDWRDSHVPGAVSRFSGAGGLNIYRPSLAVFRDFRLDVGSLDLRSIEYLFPSFPPLGGTITGVATLDSIWTDVRFHDADLTHTDGPGEPTRVTGSGRVTNGPIMRYDVSLDAKQIGFEMLRRSYPTMPAFKGVMGGPIRARGTTSDLELAANLQGAAGTMSFDGRVDIDSIGGYGAHGKGDVAQLDLHTLLADTTAPRTQLNGHYDVGLDFKSTATLAGTLAMNLERSLVDKQHIDSGRVNLLFADGQIHLADDLNVAGPLGRLRAPKGGGIGLPGGRPDSLRLSLTDINLDEIRGYLKSFTAADSLRATDLRIDSSTTISGRADSLRVRGTLLGSDVALLNTRANTITTFFDIDQALTNRHGLVALRADSVLAGGLTFESTHDTLTLSDSTQGTFAVHASAGKRPDLEARGLWSRIEGATTIGVQSGRVILPNTEWALAAPASIVLEPAWKRIDEFVFHNRTNGSLAFGGLVPDAGTARFAARGSDIPLRDVATAAQIRGQYNGTANFSADATGTRDDPIMTLYWLRLDSLGMGFDNDAPFSLGQAAITGRYQNKNLTADLKLTTLRDSIATVTAHASLPVELTLFSGKSVKDTLSGYVDANDMSLFVIQPFVSGVSFDTSGGKVKGHLTFAGRRTAPVPAATSGAARIKFFGDVTVEHAGVTIDDLFTRYTNVNGKLRLLGDSVAIDALSATSQSGTATITGSVSHWDAPVRRPGISPRCEDSRNPMFDLRMRADGSFQVMNDPTLAEVEIRTLPGDTITLFGPKCGARLTGAVLLPRATIFIPDPGEATKQLSEFSDFSPGKPGAADSARHAPSGFVDSLVQHLSFPNFDVSLGEDVRLKTVGSDIIDVKLASSGPLQVVRNTKIYNVEQAAKYLSIFRGIGLAGEMRSVSGNYTFYAGPVQRQFTVQQGGTIRFNGDLNPTLAIGAHTSVRVVGRDQRLGITAILAGPLDRPRVSFTSDQSYPISDTDLASYLAFGQPAFALDRGALQSLLTSTGSAWLSGALRSRLGLDALQLEAAPSSVPNSDFIRGTRVAGEKEFARGLFFTFNTGLCAFKSQFDVNLFQQGLGGSVTYRFPDLRDSTGRSRPRPGSPSIRGFLDPPSAAQFCSPGTLGLNGLAPTPRQFGISLSNSWSWR